MKSLALRVKNLRVVVAGKTVVESADIAIARGEVGVLGGANGGGKSSLVNAIMGNSNYQIKEGLIELGGENITALTPDERTKKGLYVTWQNPVMIPGVKVFSLAKAMREQQGEEIKSLVALKNELESKAVEVGLTPQHINRSINDGFSGGERKRLELLWLLWSKPKVVVMDEIDSGMDEEGRSLLVTIIKKLAKQGVAFLIITHYESMITALGAARIWGMKNGRLSARK